MIGGLGERRSSAFREFPLIVFVARVLDVDRARSIRLIDERVNFATNVVVVNTSEDYPQITPIKDG